MSFNAAETKDRLVQWIRDWFEINGKGCNAVVGISGGKDSSVVAALCVEALGKDRVIGIMMPQGDQSDIEYSRMLCDHLRIDNYTVNIYEPCLSIKHEVSSVSRVLLMYLLVSEWQHYMRLHRVWMVGLPIPVTFLKIGLGMQQDMEMEQEILAH